MPSNIQIALAETEEEKRAVYRFRYRIYVEEIFYATEDGEPLRHRQHRRDEFRMPRVLGQT